MVLSDLWLVRLKRKEECGGGGVLEFFFLFFSEEYLYGCVELVVVVCGFQF